MTPQFQPGDWIICRQQKRSTRPGPRAEDVRPALHGEDYLYHVKEYWTVLAVRPDGRLIVRTARGRQRVLSADQPTLRRARWWERFLWRDRFPGPAAPTG